MNYEVASDLSLSANSSTTLVETDCNSTLNENLSRLVTDTLAAQIRNAPLNKVELRTTASGHYSVCLAGELLCSNIDPKQEAEEWANSIDIANKDYLVVFGLASGYHLDALRKHSTAKIFVVEPNLGLIRAVLSARKIPFCDVQLVESPDALRRSLSATAHFGNRVSIIAWPSYRRLLPHFFLAVLQAAKNAIELASVSPLTLEKRVRVWIRHVLENLSTVVGYVPAHTLSSVIQGRPVFIVAAGPSLNRNIYELAKVQDRGVIIAVNTSLSALERAGVRADFVVSVEALDVSSQFTNLSLNRDCPRILCLNGHPNLFKNAKGPVFPYLERNSFFEQLAGKVGLAPTFLPGGSVANAAFSFAWQCEASKLILVGQDLAYTNGEVYASGTVFEKIKVDISGASARLSNLDAKEKIAMSYPLIDNTRTLEPIQEVTAWGNGTVYSSLPFKFFREMYERWAETIENAELINATEGGSRIRGFKEQRLSEVIENLEQSSKRPLPQSPMLDSATIKNVLKSELDAAFSVRIAARFAAKTKTPQAIEKMRIAVNESSLVHAYTYPSLCESIRGKISDISQLGLQIADDTDELIELFSSALQKIS